MRLHRDRRLHHRSRQVTSQGASMEAATQRRPPSQGLKRFLATRRGAWVIALACAALSALSLLIFVNQYKSSVTDDLASTPVLTADRLIPKGTAGNIVVTEKLFRPGAV